MIWLILLLAFIVGLVCLFSHAYRPENARRVAGAILVVASIAIAAAHSLGVI